MILLFRIIPLAKSQANKDLLLIALALVCCQVCDKLWVPDLRNVSLAGEVLVP